MTDKEIILQTKTSYLNKVKELDQKIQELQEERKEYMKVVKIKDMELDDLIQGKLF